MRRPHGKFRPGVPQLFHGLRTLRRVRADHMARARGCAGRGTLHQSHALRRPHALRRLRALRRPHGLRRLHALSRPHGLGSAHGMRGAQARYPTKSSPLAVPSRHMRRAPLQGVRSNAMSTHMTSTVPAQKQCGTSTIPAQYQHTPGVAYQHSTGTATVREQHTAWTYQDDTHTATVQHPHDGASTVPG